MPARGTRSQLIGSIKNNLLLEFITPNELYENGKLGD